MPYDYSDPPPSKFEPKIPEGTKPTLVIHIKPGGVGEDGLLTRSKDGGCEMLAVMLTVADTAYKGEKFFENWILEGTTDGHAKAREITLRKLKAIIDSAFGLDPNDKSPEARARRTISLSQLEGMAFMAEIGIEKGSKDYGDKNIVAAVITPDKKDWHPVEQPPPFNGGAPPRPQHQQAPQRPSRGQGGRREKKDTHHRDGFAFHA
jgi:hypothetical protein